jgi:pSer/pThr/pTyr-binding forkhead associated (FHA) protein
MAARIFCRTGEFAGLTRDVADEVTIGRDPASTLVLPAKVVSVRHARIWREAATGGYFLEDLGSRNGTFIDGARIDRRTRLGDLHVITFASRHDFIFQVVAPSEPPPARPAPEASVASARPAATTAEAGPPVLPPGLIRQGAAAAQPQATIQDRLPIAAPAQLPFAAEVPPPLTQPAHTAVQLPPGPMDPQATPAARPSAVVRIRFDVRDDRGGRTIDLGEGRHVVGRSADCDVRLADKTLSREHAAIDVGPDRVTVTDLGSQHGTFVNGVRAAGTIDVPAGAEIVVGRQSRIVMRERL